MSTFKISTAFVALTKSDYIKEDLLRQKTRLHQCENWRETDVMSTPSVDVLLVSIQMKIHKWTIEKK